MLELFRIAPISSAEIIAGKVLAYGVLGAAIAAISLALLIVAFNIPVLGTCAMLAAVVGLLLLASIGLGLVVAVVSDSERQTVQLSLLILLASVFFSGFVLPLERVQRAGPGDRVPPAGHPRDPAHAGRDAPRFDALRSWEFGALAAIAAVTLLHRLGRPAAVDDARLRARQPRRGSGSIFAVRVAGVAERLRLLVVSRPGSGAGVGISQPGPTDTGGRRTALPAASSIARS